MKKAFDIIQDTCRNVTSLAQENIIWMALESNSPELEVWKGLCEEVLRLLSGRWGVAGVYLELLKVSKARDDE
ncbi:uncharacterized protein DSM5745_00796 [Aspergillus mulundensis]|uniref:Uncharacterized protein n=1 Tax=Aspergillus mulundensis TaxID=1810919 RepID=A0A3D8T4N9_9EURO|nr:hypothetical protein DSM5745_00796 [Aspergillus mulundensis]RDW93474.1 hypothetical protein DSM5745_00796 [Aspergillus mulundensis]